MNDFFYTNENFIYIYIYIEGDRTSAYFQSQPPMDLNSSGMYDRPPSTTLQQQQPDVALRSASSSRLEQSSRVEFASSSRSVPPSSGQHTTSDDLGFEIVECHVRRMDDRMLGLSLSNQNSSSSSKVDSRTSTVSFRDEQSG